VTWEPWILKYFKPAHKMSLRQQYAYVTARFSGNTAPVVNTLEYVKGL